MLLNTRQNSQEKTKEQKRLAVKTEILPTISNFSRAKRQILNVHLKSKND